MLIPIDVGGHISGMLSMFKDQKIITVLGLGVGLDIPVLRRIYGARAECRHVSNSATLRHWCRLDRVGADALL